MNVPDLILYNWMSIDILSLHPLHAISRHKLTSTTGGTVTVTFWVDAVYLMYLLLGWEARLLKFSMNLARSFLWCRERGFVIANYYY